MCAHVSNWWSKFSQFSYISVNSVLKLNIVCKKKLLCFNWFYKMEFLFVLQTKKFFYTFFSHVFVCIVSCFVPFILKLFIQIYYFCTYLYAFMNVLGFTYWMFWGLHIYIRNSFESKLFSLYLVTFSWKEIF